MHAVKIIVVNSDGTQDEYTNFVLQAVIDYGKGEGARFRGCCNWDCRELTMKIMLAKSGMYVNKLIGRFLTPEENGVELNADNIDISPN